MRNFSVGPVMMDEETREIGKEQIPYFRTAEFSTLMKENERLLLEFFDAPPSSRMVFMTGSGTASMEGGIINFFDERDKVLVVNGGSFGARLVELCALHSIPFSEIKLDIGAPLTYEKLKAYEGKGYTGFVLQLCETTSGVRYDMEMVGEFCKRNHLFLMVDAVSGFLADSFSMQEMHVNAAITGSQKALALPPSMSFTALDPIAIQRCQRINTKTLYFNYPLYLKDGERGQTPFTPAVATLMELNEKLVRIQKHGGVAAAREEIKERAAYFREQIKDLPFEMVVKEGDRSNCVTALRPTNGKVHAHRIFEILKDEYGIWVCPNGGELSDTIFRVGHLGAIGKEDVDALINAFKELKKRGAL